MYYYCTKPTNVLIHWVCDRCRQRSHFDVAYIKGSDKSADFYTKALPRRTFHAWSTRMVTTVT